MLLQMNNSGKLIFEEDLDNILNRSFELWNQLRGNTFFITGATGFLAYGF